MKYQPGFTDFFMSPVTGRIILPMFPDLQHNYVWLGNRGDRPLPSPIIIDLRLEIIDIRRRLSETRFILQAPSENFDSSQALNQLVPGILRHTDGIVSIAVPWIDYVPVDLPYQNIWIGDADSVPQPFPRIFLNNLPTMLSADPTLLLGAYNLYRGSPNPLTLGQPEIVKTLHITNMADLTVGHLWLGTNSSDPLNYGSNRPVEIIVLPLDNMADLPFQQIWRGDMSNRPQPVDDLTNLEERVTITEEDISEINEEITEINTKLGDINTEIGDINVELGDIETHLGDIDVHLGDIDTEIGDINTSISSILDSITSINASISSILDSIATINASITSILDAITTINTTLGSLQAQIDSNVASGLDHLADLQLQIDSAIASGNDHLATINTTLSYLQSEIDTINTSITTINSTLTDLQSQIDTINTTITTIQSDITTINTTLTSLQSQIDTINTTITDIQTDITTIQGDITNITDVLIPAVYTYIDDAISNVTNNFVAGGVINMNNNRITNLPCDPVEDNDAISFCFLWHTLHDEVTISW
jgi:predicted  nucleic acid-binding Zn-ribbon protein